MLITCKVKKRTNDGTDAIHNLTDTYEKNRSYEKMAEVISYQLSQKKLEL